MTYPVTYPADYLAWLESLDSRFSITAGHIWEAAQATERERAKVLLIELKNIANSKPSEWDDEVRDQFEEWVKNRAHAAIVKYEESK